MSEDQGFWRILVVDDDPDVHDITKLALKNLTWRKRQFEITSAHSAGEARELLAKNETLFHVAIVDVVMETDDAGLELCKYVRSTFGLSIRLILRTGQPGIAPEEWVLENFDIDDYLSKSEATAARLFSAIRVCLRASQDISEIEASNRTLSVANAELTRHQTLAKELVSKLNDQEKAALIQMVDGTASPGSHDKTEILAVAARELERSTKSSDFRTQMESTLSRKGILILLKNRKALAQTKSVLAGTMSASETADNQTAAMQRLKHGNIDLLFLDWENMGILSEAIRYNPRLLAVLLTTQPIFEEHGRVIMNLPVSSAVVINSLSATDIRPEPLTINEMMVTAAKLLSGDVFGLEKYLSWGASVKEITLRQSTDRANAIEEVERFSKGCQLKTSLRRKLVQLTDELLMNAIWDAPVDEDGKPKYAKLPRNMPVALTENEAVQLRYATDGNLLAVSVTDNFGTLTRETAFRYLIRCFGRTDNQISMQAGGAGLGLYMAYLAISTFVINVAPGKKTEVIGILNLRLSNREMAERPRAFHYFCQD